MAEATIKLTDTGDGQFEMAVDFGEKFDGSSIAHQVIASSAESILKWSGNWKQTEDTAPEVNVEPGVIITALNKD
jgi:hypothetical protein